MTPKHDGTPTPAIVSSHATQEVQLERIALLGTFGAAQTPSALIRLPRGTTQTVAIGDTVAGGTVKAIETDRLILSRMGRAQVLRMPQS